MNVFTYSTYKEFLKAFIAHNGSRGIISQIASICACDRTYISQVLNGKADMTPDHMIQFCENFGFDEAESNFLLTLLLRDRSTSPKARRSLDGKLKQLKSEAMELSNKVNSKERPLQIREELRTLYYSNWIYGAVHILTSIPGLQTPAAIAQKLQLPILTVGQVLKDLIEMGLVKDNKGFFLHAGGDVYLSRQSPQISTHHLSWRMKAVERSHIKDDVHYSLAFSVSESEVEKLRMQIIDLIEMQRKQVQSSGAEVACVFCVDFFCL